jgi:hypothetical protein
MPKLFHNVIHSYPFYQRARDLWLETQVDQIIKGLHKYEEPFNPRSWTAEELLKHAMQENVDQQHYLVGLYEHIEDLKRANEYFKEENARLRKELEQARHTLPVLKPSYFDLDDE